MSTQAIHLPLTPELTESLRAVLKKIAEFYGSPTGRLLLDIAAVRKELESTRHWLPHANELYAEIPELAGVGMASDVLDAVKWGA